MKRTVLYILFRFYVYIYTYIAQMFTTKCHFSINHHDYQIENNFWLVGFVLSPINSEVI